MNTGKQVMRIATWNLDHASNSSRPISAQIRQIRMIDADILILTETCEAVDLNSAGYKYAIPRNTNEYGKYWSTIWSKFPITQQVDCYDNKTAVCALVVAPTGDVIVYGTIITWRDDKGPNKTSPPWSEHMKSISDHGNDWRSIQDKLPGIPLIVAGDFNQTRDGSTRTYGTKACRELLGAELTRSRLTCLTTENFGDTGKLKSDPAKGWARNNIDHICVSEKVFQVVKVGAWDHFTDSNQYMSDHNGVYVDVM